MPKPISETELWWWMQWLAAPKDVDGFLKSLEESEEETPESEPGM